MTIIRPTDKEIHAKLDFAFDGLDSERAKGLSRLKTVHSIKNDGALREQNRLKAKYGDGHPRVKKLGDRINYNIGLSGELDDEIERSKIVQASFDIDTWMVHGRVLDKEGKGIGELTMSLSDNNNVWVEELGHTCTDDRGYYSIRYKGAPGEISEKLGLFLTVADSASNVLHRETIPLFVRIGQIDFRLIVIEDQGEICVAPKPENIQIVEPPSDAWSVQGSVLYDNGKPGRGLTVSLYDKELLFEDDLGVILTDDNGWFNLVYETYAFPGLFEAKPDIYLKILDSAGKILFQSTAFSVEAGHVEKFDIKIGSAVNERIIR